MTSTTSSLGPVVVFGGCGLVGYHIVQNLLLIEDCGPISVAKSISNLLDRLKPRVIFHCASPAAVTGSAPFEEYYSTNVIGTKNLLSCASSCSSVKAFVFTSSTSIYKGHKHIYVDESASVWDESSETFPYMKAKAIADATVLQANSRMDGNGYGLLTVTLRPHLIYGECDSQFMPSQMAAIKAKRTNLQVGNGRNKFTPVYAGNLAQAHILAARKLLTVSGDVKEGMRVDGQAFNIHDGDAVVFWDFVRLTWSLAGNNTKAENIKIIPAWVAIWLSVVVEWVFKIFTLGQIYPPREISTLSVQHILNSFTYNIEKARKRLGYDPVCNHEENLRKSMAWELDHSGQKWKGVKMRDN